MSDHQTPRTAAERISEYLNLAPSTDRHIGGSVPTTSPAAALADRISGHLNRTAVVPKPSTYDGRSYR